jgi:hypothetical protein
VPHGESSQTANDSGHEPTSHPIEKLRQRQVREVTRQPASAGWKGTRPKSSGQMTAVSAKVRAVQDAAPETFPNDRRGLGENPANARESTGHSRLPNPDLMPVTETGR